MLSEVDQEDRIGKRDNLRRHLVTVGYLNALVAATHLGWSEQQVFTMMEAGVSHDRGKLSVPWQIDCKRGRLTPAEYAIMMTHVTAGEEYVRERDGRDSLVADIVKAHHDNFPKELKDGDDPMLPIMQEVNAIDDSVDAMRAPRCYRSKPMKAGKVFAILTKKRHLNPELVRFVLRARSQIDFQTTVQAAPCPEEVFQPEFARHDVVFAPAPVGVGIESATLE